jgi:hypothetical protein
VWGITPCKRLSYGFPILPNNPKAMKGGVRDTPRTARAAPFVRHKQLVRFLRLISWPIRVFTEIDQNMLDSAA